MEDESLVLRIKQGDRQAFDEIYQKYKRPILNYIYRFIGSLHSAEELTQEAFVRVYVNIHKYEPKAKFSSWLYRIAGNLARNFLRHASYDKRMPVFTEPAKSGEQQHISVAENIADNTGRPDKQAQSKEEQSLVQKAIDQLPEHLKEAVILCDIEGFSYDEASDIMRCRPMTVGSRLSRGRQKLAKLLRYTGDGQ
ncbi:MAG: sigma-70 family RNA polymerase sigma factor [Candidatus Omnitrophica bacterium]|nr:sigma-70 family RNA polymerase sigma factor [Candidatus Omnitrophota bacterium]